MTNPKYNKTKGAVPLDIRLLRKRNVTETGCWEWTGWRNNKGYGMMGIGQGLKLCHRVSYEFYVGQIPEGHFVLHKCDNPACYNPDHLFTGTHKDNMKDMDSKGRRKNLYGLDSPNGKLTNEQVAQIRADYKPATQKGRGYKSNTNELAEKFGITPQYVLQLIKGDWRKNG